MDAKVKAVCDELRKEVAKEQAVGEVFDSMFSYTKPEDSEDHLTIAAYLWHCRETMEFLYGWSCMDLNPLELAHYTKRLSYKIRYKAEVAEDADLMFIDKAAVPPIFHAVEGADLWGSLNSYPKWFLDENLIPAIAELHYKDSN